MSKKFNEILEKVPKWRKNYLRMSMDIAQYIEKILKNEDIKQAELAKDLEKHESEISKWLSGNHNFTLKSLAKLEDILDHRIVLIPQELAGYMFKPEFTITRTAVAMDTNLYEFQKEVAEFSETITLTNENIKVTDAA